MSNFTRNRLANHRGRIHEQRAALAEQRRADTAHQLTALAAAREEQAVERQMLLLLEAERRQAAVQQQLHGYAVAREEQAAEQQMLLLLEAEQRQAVVQQQLHGYAVAREEQAAEQRAQVGAQIKELRRRVAEYLNDLAARRASRATGRHSAANPAPARSAFRTRLSLSVAQPVASPATPVDASAAPSSDSSQRLGQAGLVAYAQMARVVVLRELESGTLGGEAQQRQIDACLDGLTNSLRPFLADLHAAQATRSSEQRAQLLAVVDGVRRSVASLHSELDSAPWPTGPAQRQVFGALVLELRRRLEPLQEELAAAALTLQADEPRARVGRRAKPQAAGAQPTGRSYRDNLTSIHGIGPAIQQRLNRAGICTYIQLALSSPDDLRKALGESGRMANIEDWIMQARALAGLPA